MFRRRGRRPFRRNFSPDIPPMLQRANEMMAGADYEGAAAAYEGLARGAEARNGPRAPMLFLQAGRARLDAGQTAAATEHFKYGLNLFARRGQGGKAVQTAHRIVDEMKQRGLATEAGQLEAYLQGLLPDFANFVQTDSPASVKRSLLPTHCPACGAALRPDEVEWLDDETAECAYCGSPVRGES
jgi:hypothetical protein